MLPFEYQQLQMRLEGIGLDQDGRLVLLRENVDESPHFLFVQGESGEKAQYFSANLPLEAQLAIKQQGVCLEFPNSQPIVDILDGQNIQFQTGHFKTHRFPEGFQSPNSELAKSFASNDPKVVSFSFNGMAETVYAVEQNGEIVSACVSVREDKNCAESWVVTAPEHRRKGFAEAAVSLWAMEVLKKGKVPFYSYALSNLPSAHLANKLGAVPVFEIVVLGGKWVTLSPAGTSQRDLLF